MPPRSPKCPPEEFQRLIKGLQPAFVLELLDVSHESLRTYRREGAPEYRVTPLRKLFRERAEESDGAAA